MLNCVSNAKLKKKKRVESKIKNYGTELHHIPHTAYLYVYDPHALTTFLQDIVNICSIRTSIFEQRVNPKPDTLLKNRRAYTTHIDNISG